MEIQCKKCSTQNTYLKQFSCQFIHQKMALLYFWGRFTLKCWKRVLSVEQWTDSLPLQSFKGDSKGCESASLNDHQSSQLEKGTIVHLS